MCNTFRRCVAQQFFSSKFKVIHKGKFIDGCIFMYVFTYYFDQIHYISHNLRFGV